MKLVKTPVDRKTMKKEYKAKTWTQKQDDKFDREHHLAEGSKADIKQDRLHGIKDKKKKKNWIQGAIKHPGALHRQLGVKQGNKIPARRLAQAASKGGVLGRRARLAETLKGLHHKRKTLKKKTLKARK